MRPDQVLFSRHQDFFPAKLLPLRLGVTASRQSGDAGQGVPFPSGGIAVIPVPTTTRRSDRVQLRDARQSTTERRAIQASQSNATPNRSSLRQTMWQGIRCRSARSAKGKCSGMFLELRHLECGARNGHVADHAIDLPAVELDRSGSQQLTAGTARLHVPMWAARFKTSLVG